MSVAMLRALAIAYVCTIGYSQCDLLMGGARMRRRKLLTIVLVTACGAFCASQEAPYRWAQAPDTLASDPAPKNDVATWWKSFAPEQREAMLRIMTPEQKHMLRELIEPGTPQMASSLESVPKVATGEQQTIEQLRVVAEAIKKCPEVDQSIPDFTMAKGKDAGPFRRKVGAPVNVIWDVERRPSSIRSPEIGFIEFTTNASCDATLNTVTCKRKDDTLCWALFRADSDHFKQESDYCQNLKPNHYRYEFDFGKEGLEFARALSKPETADKSLWAAIDLERGKDWSDAVATSPCVADAVRLSAPTNAPDTRGNSTVH
jgi:hypothetical protein